MQIVNLVVNHDCPFSRPVINETGARVTHLCHRGQEAMLEVHHADPEALRRLISEYVRIGGEVVYPNFRRASHSLSKTLMNVVNIVTL